MTGRANTSFSTDLRYSLEGTAAVKGLMVGLRTGYMRCDWLYASMYGRLRTKVKLRVLVAGS